MENSRWLATDRFYWSAILKSRVFDTSTEAGLKAAERYKTRLENKYDKVTTTPAGLNRVRIEGQDVQPTDGSCVVMLSEPEAAAPVSYAPEVIADDSGKWVGNALRFATKDEAEKNVQDLMYRWFLVRETRVVESSDPVNYRWVDGVGLEMVKA